MGSGFEAVEFHNQIMFNNQIKNYTVPSIQHAFGVDIMGLVNPASSVGHEVGMFADYSKIHIMSGGEAPPEYSGFKATYSLIDEFVAMGGYYDFILKFDRSLQYRVGIQIDNHARLALRTSLVIPVIKLNNDQVRLGLNGKYKFRPDHDNFGPINFMEPNFSLGAEIIF